MKCKRDMGFMIFIYIENLHLEFSTIRQNFLTFPALDVCVNVIRHRENCEDIVAESAGAGVVISQWLNGIV